MTTLKSTKQGQSSPTNPLEKLYQDILSGQHGFGHTVTEATDILGGPEYQVVFPANRGYESQSNTSTDSNPLQASKSDGSSSEPDGK